MAERGEPTFTIAGSMGNTAGINTRDSAGQSCTTWTPSNYTYSYPYYQVDKTRQAFMIIKLLEEKGFIKLTSVKKFMELVDEIYKVL